MSEPLITALLISLAGMGLVLGAILLLWGVIALLVALTGQRDRPQAVPTESFTDDTEMELKQQAAAAAVAAVLTREAQPGEPHEFPLPPTALVSAWQAVMRSNIFNKRGSVR